MKNTVNSADFRLNIELMDGEELERTLPFREPIIFRKVTKALRSTPSGYKMAAKRVNWGVIILEQGGVLAFMRVNKLRVLSLVNNENDRLCLSFLVAQNGLTIYIQRNPGE